MASLTSVQTNVIIALATALVASVAGAAAVAGYGTGARLEYLLIPLVFGLGAPLVAMVGTNIGAGHRERALRIAYIGGAMAFAVTETIGIAARSGRRLAGAVQPRSAGDRGRQRLSAHGRPVLRLLRPRAGALFRLPGRRQLLWPMLAGFLRMAVALGGGWLALRLTGSLSWLFAAVALGLVLQGVTMVIAIMAGAWGKAVQPARAD